MSPLSSIAARGASCCGGSASPASSCWRSGCALWGLKQGLPYAYNADENAHFLPRAIGMFGHDLDPGYYVNPPAYTYVLHILLAIRYGGRLAVGEAFASDPTTVWTMARAASAVLGTVAVGLLYLAGGRLAGRAAGLLAAALLAVAFLPVFYSHLALNDVPTLAPLCLALWGAAGVLRTGRGLDYLDRGDRHRPRGGDEVHGRDRAARAARGVRRPRDAQPRRRAARAAARRRHGARGVLRRVPVRDHRPPRVPRRAEPPVRRLPRGGGQARLHAGQRLDLLPLVVRVGAGLGAARRGRRRAAAAGLPAPTGRSWRSWSRRRSSTSPSWARRSASSGAGSCRCCRSSACSPRSAP